MKRVPDIRPVPLSDGLQEITCPCGELVYSASSFGRCPSCRRWFGFSPSPGRDYQEKFFIAPFVHIPKYYEKVSYDEVFREVQKHIGNDVYRWTYLANYLKDTFPPDIDLTQLLQSLRPYCPDLSESDSPGSEKLAAHFGRHLIGLLRDFHYAPTPQEREKAREEIDAIIKNKAPERKRKKIPIPPPLSLNDMYAYVHRITDHLRRKYTKKYEYDPLPEDVLTNKTELTELHDTDPRLVEIQKKGITRMLIKRPHELTIKLMAQFLGVTPKTLRQRLKEEKKPPVSSPPQKR